MTVCLVRAGETEFSRQGRLEGDLDLPLTDHGRAAARRAVERKLGGTHDLDAVYCASNQSSRETAEIVAEATGGTVHVLPGLRGVSLGLWEGQLLTDVRQRHCRIYGRWVRDPLSITPPNGEEMGKAWDRTGRAARRIGKKHRDGRVAVVAPGTVLGLLYCHLTDRSPECVFAVEETIGPVEPVPAGTLKGNSH